MRRTEPLTVHGNYPFDKRTIGVNPNDGFDWGLMTTEHSVEIYAGWSLDEFANGAAEGVAGVIHLKNECRANTVELSTRTVERLGKPRQIVLVMQDGRLLLQPV